MHGFGYFTGPDNVKRKGEWVEGKRICWVVDKKK